MFSFTGPGAQRFSSQGPNPFINALTADRQMLFRKDALRSLIMVLLCAGLLYAFYFKKIRQEVFFVTLAFLILVDMWPVDKRYLNKDNFGTKRTQQQGFQPTAADRQILQDPDLYYRVFDLSGDPFNSARASYFHKSIGGYHGAKMQRYQEIISYQIAKNNMNVLDMLNTKYFILSTKDGEPRAQLNPGALGNSWLVSSYRIVENANEEMEALNDFNPASEAIIDRRFESYVSGKTFSRDTAARISLETYHPNRLVYSYRGTVENLAVFSDIYYDKGWKAFVDGVEVPHFRVDYILRGMVLPAGEHSIEFRFEPRSYYTGIKIAAVGWEIRQKTRKDQ
jgi:hypothetical protein